MGKEIIIRDLTFSYGGNGNQLEHISLDIAAGEVIVMTGPSGSGKSSLTRVINGLIPYFYEGELSGEVFVDGKPLKEIPSWERGKIVGNVFQDPRSQFFANEVAGEVAFGCENYGYSHEEIRNHVHRAAADIKIQDILDHSLHSLSYGMRQKVAIASAEAIDPEIYVMDEPSANLDIASTYRFADIIRDLKQQGKTIIIAEHRLYYLMDLADRFLCVQKGKIVREFTAQQMKALTNKEIQALGLRTPDLHQIEQTEIPSAATSEVVLEAKKLNHSFGETIVAKDIDFQCRKGEVIALIGPNGTGKSTIGRILAGLLKEKSGEVVLFGKHCRPKGRLGKVWYIPQDLDSQLFGEDLLDELTTGAEVSPERKQAAEEILEALELMPFIKQHPSTLSGGQKQRVTIAAAITSNKRILILDEPTSGLDYENMKGVSEAINNLRKKGIHIGEHCIIRAPRTARIDVSRPSLVTIGNNVDMNMNFQILTHDWASLVFRTKYNDFVNSSGHVTIGNNIYLGTNVVVLKGVTIGDNCVIGACSLVTKNIPANSVAAGVPCRVICSIDEYYRKRKQVALAEAVEYVQSIQKRFKRDPFKRELYEEFIYFTHKDNIEQYEQEGSPVKSQLGIAYTDFIQRDEANFKDYEAFLQYVNKKGVIFSENNNIIKNE